MTYLSVAHITVSGGMRDRLTACASIEGVEEPYKWVVERIWDFAAMPGWGDSWASGEVTYPGEDIGLHEDVITDGAILSAVQAKLAEEA